MKATKNMNGAARVAVQAKLDAVDKELRQAHALVQQRTEELGHVRKTVAHYTERNDALTGQVADLKTQLDLADRQLKWVGASCRKHLDTIQALEAQREGHAEAMERLERELDDAEDDIQYLKDRVRLCKLIGYGLCGLSLYLAGQLAGYVGWFGGAL